MIRAVILHNVRCVSRIALRPQSLAPRTVTPCFSAQSAIYTPSKLPQSARWYSAPAGLSKPEVEGRIMDLLKGFDKVTDQAKVSGTSHFSNDLGLDSLDTVEVVMAIEEEFSIEIPDKEADAIHSIDKAVEYILSQPDGKLALSSSSDVTDRRHSALRRIGLAGEALVCFAGILGGGKACVV